ncbi:hypothetical protein DVH24_034984 [Malus domestica]|uniref:Secreted protein n=1 Tax=Malus domestica TaxID=3750 RepID=A0A498IJX6_MALDO|nr:hypothetical protein DVH24_034984 [Malus domestica]
MNHKKSRMWLGTFTRRLLLAALVLKGKCLAAPFESNACTVVLERTYNVLPKWQLSLFIFFFEVGEGRKRRVENSSVFGRGGVVPHACKRVLIGIIITMFFIVTGIRIVHYVFLCKCWENLFF